MGRLLRIRLGGVLTLAVLALAGCTTSVSPAPAASSGPPVQIVGPSTGSGLSATDLGSPIPKPTVTLTDTAGRPYDLPAQTSGRLTLLFFGYTHCPDVCPTTMADLAMALQQVPQQVRFHTTVVFVTSDPARDTGAVMRSWLDRFSTAFVGLTGSMQSITAMADAVGVPLEPPVTAPDGEVSVTHGGQVVVFSPTDNLAHLIYSPGTTVPAYAHDLPLLAAGRT